MGLWYIRRGRLDRAEQYLRRAVKLAMKRNPQPYDGEPLYNLAICLKYQGMNEELRMKDEISKLHMSASSSANSKPDSSQTSASSSANGNPDSSQTNSDSSQTPASSSANGNPDSSFFILHSSFTDEAYHWFWKVTWNKAWADAGYFEAAKISVMQGRLDDALEELRRCLNNNCHNQKALALKAAVLRLMGRKDDAIMVCEDALKTDLFNYGCRYELALLTSDSSLLTELKQLMHGSANNYQELALDYQAAGLFADAEKILELSIEEDAITPMTYYYMGRYEDAEKACPDYCFPNRIEDIIALEVAKKNNPTGSMAPYYLGCLYYDKRQYDVAAENWELSARLNPEYPTVWRDLALYYFNKQHNADKAVECLERAFALDDTDARIYMELDQLYKRLGHPHAERLAIMQQHLDMVEGREDLKLEYATLLNLNGRYDDAIKFIDAHTFHVWEGGEGKVPAQYQLARTELAKQLLKTEDGKGEKGNVLRAIELLKECLEYPWNLGEGKLYGAQEQDFYYFLGYAYEKLAELSADEYERQHNHELCITNYELAAKGDLEPAAAMYYNDAKPEKIFYQGLALLKLGRTGEAKGKFYKLINYGKQHIFDNVVMDYFAVSLPDLQIWEGNLNLSNKIHCKFMLALGYYGLGNINKSQQYLAEVEQLDINHLGIYALRTLMETK